MFKLIYMELNCFLRRKMTEWLALAWLILASLFIQCSADRTTSISQLTYSGTELLVLQDSGVPPSSGLLNDVPRKLWQHHGEGHRRDRKARKRGRRGGVRQHLRRATKLPQTYNGCSIHKRMSQKTLEILKANALNSFFNHFETDNIRDCSALLENVTCK